MYDSDMELISRSHSYIMLSSQLYISMERLKRLKVPPQWALREQH